jgi:hypothetical protein
MALRRYGDGYTEAWAAAARAYLDAVEGVNYLLAAEIEARLAERTAPEEEALKPWEWLRAEIEDPGFREGVRDVLHFADEDAQLAAWWKLAAITEDPDQAEIDAYLRGLAPAGMVYVPAGAFLMGSAEDDPDADDDEKPQHEVELAGYYIGRYPVTNDAFAAFVAATGYETEAETGGGGWVDVCRRRRSGRRRRAAGWRDNASPGEIPSPRTWRTITALSALLSMIRDRLVITPSGMSGQVPTPPRWGPLCRTVMGFMIWPEMSGSGAGIGMIQSMKVAAIHAVLRWAPTACCAAAVGAAATRAAPAASTTTRSAPATTSVSGLSCPQVSHEQQNRAQWPARVGAERESKRSGNIEC